MSHGESVQEVGDESRTIGIIYACCAHANRPIALFIDDVSFFYFLRTNVAFIDEMYSRVEFETSNAFDVNLTTKENVI